MGNVGFKKEGKLVCLSRANRVLLLAFLLIANSGFAQPKSSLSAARGLAMIDSLLAAEALPAAVQNAKLLVAEFGQDPLYGWQLKGRLGLALVRSGDAAGAVAPLTEAIMSYGQDPVLHRNLAYALKILGRKGRALAEYETVVQMVPNNAEARLEFGQTLLEFRDYGRAERELLLASRLCGQCLAADRALANLYLGRADQAQAVSYLQRIWRLAPAAQVRLLLVTSLVASGQGARALALLDSLPQVTLAPDEWRALAQAEADNTELGTRWSRLAVASLDSAVIPVPAMPGQLQRDAQFWALVAANLSHASNFDGALRGLKQALTIAPENVIYHRNLAAVLLSLGRESEARQEWDEVLHLDPEQKSTGGHSP